MTTAAVAGQANSLSFLVVESHPSCPRFRYLESVLSDRIEHSTFITVDTVTALIHSISQLESVRNRQASIYQLRAQDRELLETMGSVILDRHVDVGHELDQFLKHAPALIYSTGDSLVDQLIGLQQDRLEIMQKERQILQIDRFLACLAIPQNSNVSLRGAFYAFLDKPLQDRLHEIVFHVSDCQNKWHQNTFGQDKLDLDIRLLLSITDSRIPLEATNVLLQLKNAMQNRVYALRLGKCFFKTNTLTTLVNDSDFTRSQLSRFYSTLSVFDRRSIDPMLCPPYFGHRSEYRLFEIYGSHLTETGVRFCVNAPNAPWVNVLVHHSDHTDRVDMRRNSRGDWECHVEGVKEGAKYDFDVNGTVKIDPYALQFEKRPGIHSIVARADKFSWSDEVWLAKRKLVGDSARPINIYEAHLPSWQRSDDDDFLNYRVLALRLASHCQTMGFSHVELMGILEHPGDESWGYQVTGYFAPTARHGSLEDFQFMVNHLHQNNIGVILDWIPYHFCLEDFGLQMYDGTPLFDHQDALNREPAYDWGTKVFGLDSEWVRNFLLSSAKHTLEKWHIDGLRCDALTHVMSLSDGKTEEQWTPNVHGDDRNLGGQLFLRELTTVMKKAHPDCMIIAEDFTGERMTEDVNEGGYGFDMRMNMNWIYGQLDFMERRSPYKLSDVFFQCVQYPGIMGMTHDQCAHVSNYTKMGENPYANMRLMQTMKMCFPSFGKLTFMGSEFAQKAKWDYNSALNWDHFHHQFARFSSELNHFFLNHAPFWKNGRDNTELINDTDRDNLVLSYRRRDDNETYLVVHNGSKTSFQHYGLYELQRHTFRGLQHVEEVFNSDAAEFGGSGNFTNREVKIIDGGLQFKLPPLATVIFREHYPH